MVDSTGFVVKATGGGVQLPKAPAGSHTSVVPSGDSAYMLQSSAFRTSIYLVGQLTVTSAIGAHAKAKARAYATLKAPLAAGSSPAASANGDLWLLTDAGPLAGPISSTPSPSSACRRAATPARRSPRPRTARSPGPAAVGSATLNATAPAATWPRSRRASRCRSSPRPAQ